jgi:glycosyltransferase involved in cell wall biosynthesis
MITVVTPILDEMPFLEAWAANVERYADQVVVVDTGSTDGSLEFVRGRGYDNYQWRITRPYQWEEGRIRSFLIEKSLGDWIVWQDADELVGQDFIDALPELQKTRRPFVAFRWREFWLSPNLIRAWAPWLTEDLKRYYPVEWRMKMIRNSEHIRFVGGNHCRLLWHGRNLTRLLARHTNIFWYHYGWAFRGKHWRPNRCMEVHRSNIPTLTFFGQHPAEAGLYGWFKDAAL